MPLLKKAKMLFDLGHGEMLNLEDREFSDFSNLLQRLSVKAITTENKGVLEKLLHNGDILILGNPIDDYFSNTEIRLIVDFVRSGGGLLIVSEYGADYLQKTNLNDISGKFFGIFFNKNILKENNKINENCSSIILIQDFTKNKIVNQLRDVVIGGTCSLTLAKNAKPLLVSHIDTWTEKYRSSTKRWIKEEEGKRQIIGAYTRYGRGRVVALGDIDIFTNDSNIGLNQLDNRKLILNILNWLIEPTDESDVLFWALNQLGNLLNEIKQINNKIDNIIETTTILEKRISTIESRKSEDYKKTLEKSTIKEQKSTFI